MAGQDPQLRSGIQYPPKRSGEDVRLRGGGHTALVEHLVIALQRAVELGQVTAEHIRAVHDPLEGADGVLSLHEIDESVRGDQKRKPGAPGSRDRNKRI